MAEWALELLENKNRERPLLDRIWGPLFGGAASFGAVCYINYGNRLPVLSGIQKHIFFTTISVIGCAYMYQKRADYFAERDAVLRHYITLHPEDFKQPERKKYKDQLLPWVPIR